MGLFSFSATLLIMYFEGHRVAAPSYIFFVLPGKLTVAKNLIIKRNVLEPEKSALTFNLTFPEDKRNGSIQCYHHSGNGFLVCKFGGCLHECGTSKLSEKPGTPALLP